MQISDKERKAQHTPFKHFTLQCREKRLFVVASNLFLFVRENLFYFHVLPKRRMLIKITECFIEFRSLGKFLHIKPLTVNWLIIDEKQDIDGIGKCSIKRS